MSPELQEERKMNFFGVLNVIVNRGLEGFQSGKSPFSRAFFCIVVIRELSPRKSFYRPVQSTSRSEGNFTQKLILGYNV